MSYIRKVILQGTNDSGTITDVPVTAEGHVEVELHGPRLPFGSVHTESLTPIFQVDAVYGINSTEAVATSGTGGTAVAANNLFTCSTGTSGAGAFGALQSRKRLRYRSGQGVVGRFTGLWSAPSASSVAIVGLGTAESGFYFGYNGTSFGILHNTGGVREIQTLTITTASSHNETITITINGVANSVTVTNSGVIKTTAYEIAKGTYTGFKAEQRGDKVIFLADSVGNKTIGAISGATSAVGTWAETTAGVAATNTWIAQADWKGDKLNGSGASGVTLDPTKGNVFQIDVQYLGFGSVVFKVEVSPSGSNNADFVTVHTLNIPNTRTTPTITQPSFPFTMTAYSEGSTTNVSVSCASFAGFIEGQKKLTGPRLCYYRETSGFVGSTASTYYPLGTLRNDYVFNANTTPATYRANQGIIQVTSIGGANDDATPISFMLIRNATLAGPVDFVAVGGNSCAYADQGATSCTYTNADQLVFVLPQGQQSGSDYTFPDDITIQPGETLTLAARAVTGTATYVNGTMNTREDQ